MSEARTPNEIIIHRLPENKGKKQGKIRKHRGQQW